MPLGLSLYQLYVSLRLPGSRGEMW